MAIFRINKSKDYTTMSNFHLRDKNLSLKAKGLLSLMLSLPEDWDYSVRGLEQICKETKDTINGALHELEDNGYLIRKRIYTNGKISDWEYNIYENNDLHPKNQDIENQDIGFYDNNKILNNKILNNNINNMNIIYNWEDNESCGCLTKDGTFCMRRSTYKINGKNYCNQHSKAIISKLLLKSENKFQPPTLEEVEEYCKERNSTVDPKTFYEYFDAGNWVDSKGNKVKNWKQKIITWEKQGSSNTFTKTQKESSVPEWFNKDITVNPIDNEEMESILREFRCNDD